MNKMKFILFASLIVCFLSQRVSADSDSILFVYYNQFEPFSWEADNQMQGMFIDIINEVFEERLGISVRHEGYPWKRAQQMVQDGSADAMCTVATSQRLEYAVETSFPVLSINFKIFTAVDHPRLIEMNKIETLSDLGDLALADIAGSGWAAANLQDRQVYYADTYDQLFQMLIQGRADAAIRNDWQTQYLLNKAGFGNDIIALPQPMTSEPIEYTILIGKSSPFAEQVDRINNVLEQMVENGDILEIFEKYRDMDITADNF